YCYFFFFFFFLFYSIIFYFFFVYFFFFFFKQKTAYEITTGDWSSDVCSSSPRCGDMDGFAVTRLVIGAGFLLVAAAADVRTRRVPDPLWIGLGSIGLV